MIAVAVQDAETKAKRIVRWSRENPDRWLEQMLGVELTNLERDAVRGLRLAKHIVLGDGFQGEDRSRASAFMLIAYLHLWKESLVITAAPSGRRLEAGLWHWVESFYRAQKVPLGSEMGRRELRCSPTWYAKGFVADSPYTFAGLSPASDRVTVIVEGARDIQPEVLGSLRALVESVKHGCLVEVE